VESVSDPLGTQLLDFCAGVSLRDSVDLIGVPRAGEDPVIAHIYRQLVILRQYYGGSPRHGRPAHLLSVPVIYHRAHGVRDLWAGKGLGSGPGLPHPEGPCCILQFLLLSGLFVWSCIGVGSVADRSSNHDICCDGSAFPDGPYKTFMWQLSLKEAPDTAVMTTKNLDRFVLICGDRCG